MSLYPVVAIECTVCDRRRAVFDYDLDVAYTNEDQALFILCLAKDGWDTDDLGEADDDGCWHSACPVCAE